MYPCLLQEHVVQVIWKSKDLKIVKQENPAIFLKHAKKVSASSNPTWISWNLLCSQSMPGTFVPIVQNGMASADPAATSPPEQMHPPKKWTFANAVHCTSDFQMREHPRKVSIEDKTQINLDL